MTHLSVIDVLVVGAGPTGLMLASNLVRRGVTCRIIDQEPAFHIGSRARGLSPRSMELFDDLDLIDQIIANGSKRKGVRFYDRDSKIIREVTAESNPAAQSTPDVPYRNMPVISQHRTEAVLRDYLARYNVAVELDSRLIGLTQDGVIVTASVQQAGKTEEIEARYLVGCDGGSSTVRKSASISFQGETREEGSYLFLGNISISGLDPDYMHQWIDPNRGLLMVLDPMPREGNWWFGAGLSSEEYHTLPISSLETASETLQHLFDERIGLPGVHFSNAVWLSTYRSNIRMIDHFRNGRVFLAGDAAHVHSPAGGQGMQTGLQDAYNLGWKLAHVLAGASDTLLDTYEAERLPVAQHVLETSSARLQAFTRPDTTVQAISNVLRGKDSYSDTSQLHVNYRGGPLSRDLDGTTGIRAGDRAPDAPCIFAENGERVRLFDVFRGTHFTLLSFGDRPTPRFPDIYDTNLHVYTITLPDHTMLMNNHTLIDIDRHAHHAYGVSGDALILVRPDGYIGLTGGMVDPQQIIDYLHHVLGC
jgi:2-polyprenyl-6-methoxyphenol hydroxylase-like FAD-dependent oxidoreductase